MKVLFIERDMTKASPLKTLAKSIEENGSEITFVDLSKVSTLNLIKLLLSANVAVIQYYGEIADFDKRQLAIATLLGVPIIRNWAGSDSLNVITKAAVKKNALSIDSIVTRNVTFSHLGLVNELKSVDLHCEILPKIVEFNIEASEQNTSFIPASALVYLPSNNKEFYGSNYIEVLIQKFPEVSFTIIADDEHSFAKYENVTSLGWVDKAGMLNVWNEIGLLIRVTDHDGFPRMILEALGRGKYVIHNNRSIEGVWYANDQETIETQLNHYLVKSVANHNGIKIFESLKQKDPSKTYHQYLAAAKTPFKKKLNALLTILKLKTN